MPRKTDKSGNSGVIGEEILGLLVTELPDHLDVIMYHFNQQDYISLEHRVHKLLGAIVYCDLSTLEQNLRNLRTAIQQRDNTAIARHIDYTTDSINAILESFGT
jgi:hypothetical protein